MPIQYIKTYNVNGSADPQPDDIIVMEGRLPVGEPVPAGWRVITGNMYDSQVLRVLTRWELDDERGR